VPALAVPGCPERADQRQPPNHRPSGTAELRGDLVDSVTFQFPDGYPAQLLVAQRLKEATALLGEFRGELGRGLGASDPVKAGRLVVRADGGQVDFGADPTPAAFQ
jgi:hypothetical protein